MLITFTQVLWCAHKDCIDNLYHSLLTAADILTAIYSRRFSISLLQRHNKSFQLHAKTPLNFSPNCDDAKKKLAGDGSGCAVRFCAKTCSPFVFSLFTSSRSTQSQNCAVNAQVVEQVAAYQRFSYEIYYRFASNVADWLPRKAKETPARMLIICCAHVGVKKWTLGDW